MKKGLRVLLLVCAVLLCTACGAKEPPKSEPEDFSGRYTDKQGTPDIYSELVLNRNEDGSYTVELGIYRTTTLEGTATEEDGILRFASDAETGPAVAGDITVSGETAEIAITASDFPHVPVGTVYHFPDGA